MKLSVTHADTCLSCYVLDWSKPLIGVPVNSATTYQDIRDMLAWELDRSDIEGMENASDEDVASAIAECFANVRDMSAPFDASLDAPCEDEDDMSEPCQVWFRIEAV